MRKLTPFENDLILAADAALKRQAEFSRLSEAEQVKRMSWWIMYGGIGDDAEPAGREALSSLKGGE